MRRLSWLSGLALPAIMIGSLLAASCSSTPSSPTALETSAESTKPYGSLVISANFLASVIDPKLSSPNTFQVLGVPIFDSLVELTPEGQYRPGIAEKWEISADGKTHTFYIRKGVKFHDGSDLTAADVKFSMERIMAPDSLHTDGVVWKAVIDRIDLKDDFTVALILKQPQFLLLKGFSDFGGSQAVLPKKYIEEKGDDYFRSHPVGSGPWKFVKWEAGIRLELEAVESHWRAVPKFKNITLLNAPQEAPKVAMLKTGELDLAEVAPDSIAQLKAAGLRTITHDGAAQYYMWPFWDLNNPEKYAFNDVRVRKAMSLSINRKELADKVFSGYGEPSVLFDVRPTAFFWDSNVMKPDPFDPEGAKKLLAEAGYPGGFDTAAWDTGAGGTTVSTLVTAITGYWRKVGINASVAAIEYNAALAAFRARGPESWNRVWSNLAAGGIFQFEKMTHGYHSTQGTPKNFKNPKLDELIEKVPVTADLSERKRLATEAAVMAINQYSAISVLDLNTLYAFGPKIGQVIPIKGMTALGASLETLTHAK
ncbi:MAG: ABC transporter substrate-binding protein [Dehalococcoidia bacterium]|nr:ABC transporter substrate-binding protein [Dehalococcoidia bacterium]